MGGSMAICLAALASVFGVPAYYLARSKGRSGFSYAFFMVILGLPSVVLGLFGFILPAIGLGILYLLPGKSGAPGNAYLKITFACPECGKTISFPRDREGAAELCPACGELIRVLTDEHSPEPSQRDRRKPQVAEGEVCFESFARQEPAHVLVAILSENGVRARMAADDGGGFAGFIGSAEGYRVLINVEDWDEAVRIEKECQVKDAGALPGKCFPDEPSSL